MSILFLFICFLLISSLYSFHYAPFFRLSAILYFPMLCTTQYNAHCMLTFFCVLNVNRVIPLQYVMSANTGYLPKNNQCPPVSPPLSSVHFSWLLPSCSVLSSPASRKNIVLHIPIHTRLPLLSPGFCCPLPLSRYRPGLPRASLLSSRSRYPSRSILLLPLRRPSGPHASSGTQGFYPPSFPAVPAFPFQPFLLFPPCHFSCAFRLFQRLSFLSGYIFLLTLPSSRSILSTLPKAAGSRL